MMKETAVKLKMLVVLICVWRWLRDNSPNETNLIVLLKVTGSL